MTQDQLLRGALPVALVTAVFLWPEHVTSAGDSWDRNNLIVAVSVPWITTSSRIVLVSTNMRKHRDGRWCGYRETAALAKEST